METAEEDSITELGTLVEALSEMAKPWGYVVEALPDLAMMPVLGIRKPGGEWLATMCTVMRARYGSFFFPDEKSGAAALISKYRSKPSWNAFFFCGREALCFPGGSPEELALKAATGIKAVLYMQ